MVVNTNWCAFKVEDADDIKNLPANVVGGSEVKEAHQNVKKEDGVQDTSSVSMSTSELPPHILVEMPALSPTMVRKFQLDFLLHL